MHTRQAQWIAFILFCIASLSDFADGYIAAKWNMRSTFGALCDPIADKILVMGVFLFLAHTGILSQTDIWGVFLLLIREIIILGLRQAFGTQKLSVLPLARWKTTVQMMAIGGFMIPVPFLLPIARFFLWVAVALSFCTLWSYAKKIWEK